MRVDEGRSSNLSLVLEPELLERLNNLAWMAHSTRSRFVWALIHKAIDHGLDVDVVDELLKGE